MQAESAAEEGGDDWPTGHFWHVADVFAPLTEEYVDAGQDWHGADAAAVEEKVPAGHEMHAALVLAPSAIEYLSSDGLCIQAAGDEALRSATHVPVLQGIHADAADALRVVE
jgi:hypothetical protein